MTCYPYTHMKECILMYMRTHWMCFVHRPLSFRCDVHLSKYLFMVLLLLQEIGVWYLVIILDKVQWYIWNTTFEIRIDVGLHFINYVIQNATWTVISMIVMQYSQERCALRFSSQWKISLQIWFKKFLCTNLFIIQSIFFEEFCLSWDMIKLNLAGSF